MSDRLTQQRLLAASHVLATPSIAALTAPHVTADHIDWYGVLVDTATMSSGERFLVEVARRIWAGEALPERYELIRRLDVVNAKRVDDALAETGELAAAA